MYFYEIHEGDTDLLSDALLAHEIEFDDDEFLRLVREARDLVLERFEEDTLVEAIANELQRRHGFVHVDDARLTAAVNVSAREGQTFLAQVQGGAPFEPDEDADDEDDDDDEDENEEDDVVGLEGTTAFRSLRVRLDGGSSLGDAGIPDDEAADRRN